MRSAQGAPVKGFSNSRLSLTVGAGDALDNWMARLAPLRARWQALGPRERRGLALAAWVLGLFLLWAVAIAPAWRTTRAAPAQLDRLDAQLQQMQRQAHEARELRAIPALGSSQAAAALRAATDTLGAGGRLHHQRRPRHADADRRQRQPVARLAGRSPQRRPRAGARSQPDARPAGLQRQHRGGLAHRRDGAMSRRAAPKANTAVRSTEVA